MGNLKKIFSLLVLVLASSPLTAAQSFEGVIEMTMKNPNMESPTPVKYLVKGGIVRMEMQSPRGDMAMIMNFKEHKIITLIPQMNSYMERTLDTAAQRPSDAKKPEFTKTGKTEKILGYDCEQYIVKDEKSETEVWAAKGLGSFMRPRMGGPMGGGRGGMGGGQQASAWEEEIRAKGFFPMRSITKNAEGKEESRLEVTKIEKKDLDDSLFKAPEGWQKMDMPMFGRPRN